MIIAAIVLAFTKAPMDALFFGLATWLVIYLIKSSLGPNIVDTYLWSCCLVSMPVNLISFWILRWIIYFALVIYAISTGAPIAYSALIMGAGWLYDAIIVFSKGS